MTAIEANAQQLPEEIRLTGVGGWLLFYVITSFLSVATSIYFLWHPQFTDGPVFLVISILIELTTSILILTKNSLAIPLVGINIAFNVIHTVYSWRAASPHQSLASSAGSYGIVVAVNLTWYFYFKTSRRVRFTLGRNLK